MGQVIVVESVLPQFIDAKVGVVAADDLVKLLIAEHAQPFWADHLQEATSEKSCFFLDLGVALEVGIAEEEVHLVFSE